MKVYRGAREGGREGGKKRRDEIVSERERIRGEERRVEEYVIVCVACKVRRRSGQ
jgi:hypothetical protein